MFYVPRTESKKCNQHYILPCVFVVGYCFRKNKEKRIGAFKNGVVGSVCFFAREFGRRFCWVRFGHEAAFSLPSKQSKHIMLLCVAPRI